MNCIRCFTLFILILIVSLGYSQCPKLIDGDGVATANPIWKQCNGAGYTLFIETNQKSGAYTINWGDGTSGEYSTVPIGGFQHVYDYIDGGQSSFDVSLSVTGPGGTTIKHSNGYVQFQLIANP